MTLKHELTWDGVAVILALVAGVVFITRLQVKAEAAQTQSSQVAVQQIELVKQFQIDQATQNEHLGKIDTAIALLSQIVAERTGKPIPESKP